MNELISEYKVYILIGTVLIATIIYFSTVKDLGRGFRKKNERSTFKEGGFEFDFIEGRSTMELVIALDEVVELEHASSLEESADIVWRFQHDTGETEVVKDSSSPAQDLLDKLMRDEQEKEGEKKVAEQNRIWLKPESPDKLGDEYKDYVKPKSDHRQIEDDMQLAEMSRGDDFQSEFEDEDLSDIGHDQEL